MNNSTRCIRKEFLFKTLLATTCLLFIHISSINATIYYSTTAIRGTNTWTNPLGWIPYPPGTTIDLGDEVHITTTVEINTTVINNGTIIIDAPSILIGILITPELVIQSTSLINGTTGVIANLSVMTVNATFSNLGSIATSGTFRINSGIIDNSGSFQNSKYLANNTGTINNNSGGKFYEHAGSSTSTTGTLNLREGSIYTIYTNFSVLNNGTLNWIGGNIVLTPTYTYSLNHNLEIPSGSTLVIQGILNILPSGVLTINETSAIKTDTYTTPPGQINLKDGGKMVYKGNVVLPNPNHFLWEGGTVAIAGVNANSIDVPANGYLDIDATGVFNITSPATRLTIHYATAITNKGIINLNSGGRFVAAEGALLLPGGQFNWSTGGIADVGYDCTLYLESIKPMPAGTIMNMYGKLNTGLTPYPVFGTIEFVSKWLPNITGSGLNIGNGGVLNLGSSDAAFSYEFPAAKVSMSAGSTIKVKALSTYVLPSSFTIPANGFLQIDGKLTVNNGQNLTIATNGRLENYGEMLNHGTISNQSGFYSDGNIVNYQSLINEGLFYPRVSFYNLGSITNKAAGTVIVEGTFEDYGTASNTGIFDVYGNLICGTSNLWAGGTVNMYNGCKITANYPLAFNTNVTIPTGAEFKLGAALDIQSGSIFTNNGIFSLSSTGTGLLNLRTGGTVILNTSTSLLPNIWETGSAFTIGTNATFNKSAFQIPSGTTFNLNGYLTSYLMTNNGAMNVGGTLNLDAGAGQGITNSGILTNTGAIIIGATTSVGQYGIVNNATFNNTGGTIDIDRCTSRAIRNLAGTFTNTGTIKIGLNAAVGSYGIYNVADFNNNGGTIHIDRPSIALYTTTGTFTNTGAINIGATNSCSYGIYMGANFNNNMGGNINIDRATTTGLQTLSGTFTNKGTLTIGKIVPITNLITSGTGTFSNNTGGILKGTGNLPSVSLTNAGGTLAPGYSPGKMNFDNNTDFNSSIMAMEINGTTNAGTDFDQIVVNGSATLGGTLALSFNYTPTNGDKITILDAQALAGTFSSITGLAEGWVVNYNMPTNGKVTLSYYTPLSVELLDFKGTPQYNGNLLTWTTANEINNKGFEVERRQASGYKWDVLGFITAKGKAAIYDFKDDTPLSTSYYRLRQVDNGGKETLSKVVSVQNSSFGGKESLKIYPSVTSSFLSIETILKDDFLIVNLFGQQVMNGQTGQQIDVSGLTQGTYIFKVGEEQVKFVKQ